MDTTAQARQVATAEFDAKLSALYQKALTDISKHLRKEISNYKIDIAKIAALAELF